MDTLVVGEPGIPCEGSDRFALSGLHEASILLLLSVRRVGLFSRCVAGLVEGTETYVKEDGCAHGDGSSEPCC
jgi:hypothetical protein